MKNSVSGNLSIFLSWEDRPFFTGWKGGRGAGERDAPYIAQMLQSNHFSNVAGSRIITNLKLDVREDMYCFPCLVEYLLLKYYESDSHSANSTSDKEELEEN